MSKFEKKFGKYAIPNLTLVLIMCYVAGYIIQLMGAAGGTNLLGFLTLDPYRILHGQIWRLVTWVIVPPDSLDIFTIIMLFFYYSLGSTLERTWGTYRYNVYIFSGMLFTIIGSFLCMGFAYLITGGMAAEAASVLFYRGSYAFSTYYINLSIFLGYAGALNVRDSRKSKMDGNPGCRFDGLLCDCRQPVYEICNCGILT